MVRNQAAAFARQWIDNWNARDVASIVAHFAPDARFVSPVAAQRTGRALVQGREALFAYWTVVRSFKEFRFTLDRILWDDSAQELLIIYTRAVDGRQSRACEILRFNAEGQVASGEAMYGTESPWA